MSLSKIIADYDTKHLIIEDTTTNFLTLVYFGNVFSENLENILKISDVNINQTFSQNLNIIPSDINLKFSYDIDIPIEINNDAKFDSVYLKNGNILMNIISDYQHNGNIKITIPNLINVNTGTPYTNTIPHIYTGTDINLQANINLNEYKLIFPVRNNKLKVNFEFSIDYKKANQTKPINNIYFNASLSNIKYSKIYGCFGNISFPILEDKFSIDIFRNMFIGSINIANSKIDIITRNSYGIPLTINILDLHTEEGKNFPYIQNLLPDLPSNPITVAYPSYNQMGKYVYDTVTISNSPNLSNAIKTLPYIFAYKLEGIINSDTTKSYFAFDTSKFAVDIQFKIPLYGSVQNLILQDTLIFNYDKIDNIQYCKFNIYTENKFPVDANMQIYFVDQNYNKLDSMFYSSYSHIIKAAITDNTTNKVTSPTYTKDYSSFDKNKINNIINTKYLLVKAILNTENNGTKNVKFYSDYYLRVNIAMDIKLNL